MSNWVQYDEVANESKIYVNIQTGKKRQVDWKGRVYEWKDNEQLWVDISAQPRKDK